MHQRSAVFFVCLGLVAAVTLAVPIEQQATETEPENNIITGRGKMKNMGPLLAAGAMKIGMMGVLAFKALALLVGKALLVSKLAFLLAAIIGLKKLFSGEKHVTYEVVAHPHHSHSHVEAHGSSGHGGGGADSYSSGWGRSIDIAPTSATHPSSTVESAHELAYKAHAP